ncbi:MAG: lytic transglycosylase domain-containing protein [Pseudolabrys sp.]|jgi:hypothetical protein
MRQLFLPACLCLVTWSGATSSDTGVTFEEFSGGSLATRRVIGAPQNASADLGITHRETASAVVAIPAGQAQQPKLEDIAALIPNLPAEFPVPSGVVVNNGEPAGIPLPPIPKPVVNRSEDEVCGALTQAAQRNDVPAPFFIRLLFQESRFNPAVVSSAGAQGVAQFMPDTASEMGVDNPFDPLQAIPASARLLGNLIRQFGNLGLAAAAYNAGPKRIADWLAAKGKSKLPEETQGYVRTITGKPVENWSAASARHPQQKLPQHAPCQETAGLLAWNGPDAVPLPSPSPLHANASVKVAAAKPADKKAADKNPDAVKKTDVANKPDPAKPTMTDDTKTATTRVSPAKAKVETPPKNGRLALGSGKLNPKHQASKHERVASR